MVIRPDGTDEYMGIAEDAEKIAKWAKKLALRAKANLSKRAKKRKRSK